ncbi:MAG: glycogen-binding domain-containing protein, partial [Candidatus Acidiferrum sp.]
AHTEHHGAAELIAITPSVTPTGVVFLLHDHAVKSLRVLGSWNNWSQPGLIARRRERGLWITRPLSLAKGEYTYKFLVNDSDWIEDPANPHKVPDGHGGLNSSFVI